MQVLLTPIYASLSCMRVCTYYQVCGTDILDTE